MSEILPILVLQTKNRQNLTWQRQQLKTRISFLSMEFFILWTFSQSWALKNLPNLYWVNVEVAAKHSVMEVFFVVFHTSPLVWVGAFMLRKEPRNTEAPHINIQSPKKTSQHIKFSHKKKYCGIKDIRVLFYSSIFQMIIVFPFIVLKYISFCCHSSHSVLCCNRLVYCCFILIVKSDSNFNLNSSCQSFKSFYICLSSFFVYRLFFVFLSPNLFTLYFFLYVTLSLCHSVSLILLSLSISFFSILFLCYFVFMSFCHSYSSVFFCYSVSFSSFCRTSFFLFFS